jgi:hypothetical protein
MSYARHDETTLDVGASPAALFDHLDDQERLARHMEKPSMMMMGGKMFYAFDAAKGRSVGSVIRMGGSFLWLKLFVEEAITERDPPRRKVWETRGLPKLLIIGGYRMGFAIKPMGAVSKLNVWIDYELPKSGIGRTLGFLFAPAYARWCVRRMAQDAKRTFAAPAGAQTVARWSA